MFTVGHERGCLQLGMREDVYSWHERECLQLGKRENAYIWA